MKILFFVLIAFILSGCCGLGHLVSSSDRNCSGRNSHDHSGARPMPNAESAVYVCPMHPEITASFASKCPKCGMDLVKRGGQTPGKDGIEGEKPESHDHGDDSKGGCGR